ncbi:hypothetical protein E2C01_077144 [Portunus trituberculatus]|uniref:Uncharacterized protein n=1 Tax=Portunus trituberculatus TaxID=210409 RepID=A0A5B7IJG8_PORTR|nr:hypothetical protein [Portunus trituberculatus]
MRRSFSGLIFASWERGKETQGIRNQGARERGARERGGAFTQGWGWRGRRAVKRCRGVDERLASLVLAKVRPSSPAWKVTCTQNTTTAAPDIKVTVSDS